MAVEGAGIDRLRARHRVALDAEAGRRFIAYISQAKEYYQAARDVSPVSKPLLAYYFVLNITKALLTAVAPQTTAPDRIGHGISPRFTRMRRYRIEQESIAISQDGVFRFLAMQTGARYCYASGHTVRLVDLLRYLPEAVDLYADAMNEAPRLLEISSCYPLFANKQGWLRVEIDRDLLNQRGIGPEAVTTRCRIFGDHFRLVQSAEPTASYESKTAFAYNRSTRESAPALCAAYDSALIAANRTLSGPKRFLVVSNRAQLLSHEAVAFAVLHHLSSMVRYRPQDVERLRGTRHFWLFSSWVDRACENFLLNIASRIGGEEHIIE